MAYAYPEGLLAELMTAFSTEAAEQLQALNEGLLSLEQDGGGEDQEERIREMFRHAHTLKGGAAAVDLPEVRELSHHLESLFGLLQSGDLVPRDADFDVLYRTLDAIGALVEARTAGEDRSGVDVGALSAELQELMRSSAGVPPEDLALRRERGGKAAHAEAPRRREGDDSDEASMHRTAAGGDPAGTEEVVRISTAKLDLLMSEAAELLVARTAFGRAFADLQEIYGEISALHDTWQRTRRYRRGLSPGGFEETKDVADRLLPLLDVLERDQQAATARLGAVVDSLKTTGRRADQITSALHEDMRRARMLPLQSILGTFPRMVRDLAREQSKEAILEISGAETEVDRAVLEQIKGPLMHLLRNAVDHGLEEPAARKAAGKPPIGTIRLSAVQAGDSVRVEIADDGGGIDVSRVKAAALAKGLVEEEEIRDLGPADVLSLVFRSGFSTSPIITDVSGRGVGLDVVRQSVEHLGGTIEIDTGADGTRFSLILPLTVATTLCLLVRAGAGSFAVPIGSMIRVVSVDEADVHEVEGAQAIKVQEEPVVLADVAAELGFADAGTSMSRPAIVVQTDDRSVALVVDEVLRVQGLVVKGLPRPIGRIPKVAGAAILDTGEPVVVLNVGDVARSAGPARLGKVASSAVGGDERDQDRQKVILLADDSLTTRTLEKNILAAAGYDVRAVGDGAEAWDVLQAEEVDLLVSDVQMPRIDGFELTTMIRSDPRFEDLPVVLVTSLDSPADRRLGIEAGADAYIVKTGFDQEHLIDVIRRLV